VHSAAVAALDGESAADAAPKVASGAASFSHPARPPSALRKSIPTAEHANGLAETGRTTGSSLLGQCRLSATDRHQPAVRTMSSAYPNRQTDPQRGHVCSFFFPCELYYKAETWDRKYVETMLATIPEKANP
jgi:hypothetical protein